MWRATEGKTRLQTKPFIQLEDLDTSVISDIKAADAAKDEPEVTSSKVFAFLVNLCIKVQYSCLCHISRSYLNFCSHYCTYVIENHVLLFLKPRNVKISWKLWVEFCVILPNLPFISYRLLGSKQLYYFVALMV